MQVEHKFYIDMSNYEWQKCFEEMKSVISQSEEKKMDKFSNAKLANRHSFSYCDFINDILTNIRKGKCDYCYHVYQIVDLLKYEHDRLVAIYFPREKYFKVRLKD